MFIGAKFIPMHVVKRVLPTHACAQNRVVAFRDQNGNRFVLEGRDKTWHKWQRKVPKLSRDLVAQLTGA